MELEQWLKVYQAATTTRATKERSYWTILGGFLIANGILILAVAFLALTYTIQEARQFSTALGVLGLFTALTWMFAQARVARQSAHWERLLCSLEGEFAGGEFHRSAHKLQRGREVCVPGAHWTCNEWNPDVEHVSWLPRIAARVLPALLPIVFLSAWASLIAASWII
jgi:hypothetical protein